jgi:hypothetical protein
VYHWFLPNPSIRVYTIALNTDKYGFLASKITPCGKCADAKYEGAFASQPGVGLVENLLFCTDYDFLLRYYFTYFTME